MDAAAKPPGTGLRRPPPTHPGPALLAIRDSRPSAVAVAVAVAPKACRRQRRSRRCEQTWIRSNSPPQSPAPAAD